MRSLGRMGRFGNQLLQRSFIKAYAQEHGSEWQVSPWVGAHLFGLNDPPVTAELPQRNEKYVGGDCHRPIPPERDECIGGDYVGWCQFPTDWWTPKRRTVWGDYWPTPAWRERLMPAIQRLGFCTLIGIQIRRGDYGQGSCYDAITPISWYRDWLERYADTYELPVVFVATEDRGLVDEFARYSPVTVESLGIELQTEPYPRYNYLPEDLASGKRHLIDWFPEWWMLTQCDILLAANSTFSFTAALASPRSPQFWRPAWAEQAFVREDLWNCRPLRLDCPRGATR